MEIINAIGDICPIPVIKAKKALKEHVSIEIHVDNEIATQNLTKMAQQQGLEVTVTKMSNQEYQVQMTGTASKDQGTSDGYIVVIDTDIMGRGDDTLGRTLLKGFVYALTEAEQLPHQILLYNGGAYLTMEDSPVLEDMKQLAELGVEILTCGLCIDYFKLEGKLAVGEVTNMYRILELMSQHRVVKP